MYYVTKIHRLSVKDLREGQERLLPQQIQEEPWLALKKLFGVAESLQSTSKYYQ